jgi:hypothetical protein
MRTIALQFRTNHWSSWTSTSTKLQYCCTECHHIILTAYHIHHPISHVYYHHSDTVHSFPIFWLFSIEYMDFLGTKIHRESGDLLIIHRQSMYYFKYSFWINLDTIIWAGRTSPYTYVDNKNKKRMNILFSSSDIKFGSNCITLL